MPGEDTCDHEDSPSVPRAPGGLLPALAEREVAHPSRRPVLRDVLVGFVPGALLGGWFLVTTAETAWDLFAFLLLTVALGLFGAFWSLMWFGTVLPGIVGLFRRRDPAEEATLAAMDSFAEAEDEDSGLDWMAEYESPLDHEDGEAPVDGEPPGCIPPDLSDVYHGDRP